MKIKFLLLTISFLSICTTLYSQSLSKSTTYLLSKTKHFEVYIPKFNGADSVAYRVSRHLEYLYEPLSKTLSGKPKHYPFIIQPHTEDANGFVNNIFRRSELYLRPTQNYQHTGQSQWLDRLVIHEYRHIVQQKNFNRGFSQLPYYFLGNSARVGLSFVTIPQWFREGDAVYIESKHTRGGRGRNSYFTALYQAQLLERKKNFSYDQSILGSFNSKVPNHYVVGYLLVNHLNQHYGENIWNKITQRASKRAYLPGALTRATKKYTGKYLSKHFEQMNDSLKHIWGKNKRIYTKNSKTKNKKGFIGYEFPVSTSKGIIYLKSSFNDNNKFVLIEENEDTNQQFNSKKEIKLTRVPLLNEGEIISSDENDNLYFLENFSSSRRQRITYKRLVKYNLKEDKKTILLNKTRLVSVAISQSGEKLLALERVKDLSYILKIIDIKEIKPSNRNIIESTKKLGTTILNIPKNEQLLTPRWAINSKKNEIISIRTTYGKDEIISIDMSGKITVLISHADAWLGNPFLYENKLFFASNIYGNSKIFMKDLSTQKIYQISEDDTIADTQPIYDKNTNKLVYLTLNANNQLPVYLSDIQYDKVIKLNDKSKSTTQQNLHKTSEELLTYSTIPKDFLFNNDAPKIKELNWNIKGIRPYQWGFYSDNTTFNYFGINLADKLNFFKFQLGYFFPTTFSNNYDGYHFKTTYDGFNLGELSIELRRTNYNQSFLYINREEGKLENLIPNERRANDNFDLGFKIPLWIRNTHFLGSLSTRPSIELLNTSNTTPLGNFYKPTYRRLSLNNNLVFSLYRPVHYRALYSRLGFQLRINSMLAEYNLNDVNLSLENGIDIVFNRKENNIVNHSILGAIFLPGLFKNDSFVFLLRYSEFNDSQLRSSITGEVFFDTSKSMLTRIIYYMPFVYPDITLYSLINLKRLSWVFNKNLSTNLVENYQTSYWRISLWADINLLRIPQDLRLSINYVINNDGSAIWSFGFNVFSFIGSSLRN